LCEDRTARYRMGGIADWREQRIEMTLGDERGFCLFTESKSDQEIGEMEAAATRCDRRLFAF
jgi:hypothetical protein